jgi:hypothetical protein
MRPIHDDGLLKLVDGNVVRMTVSWGEYDDKVLKPASYNVDGLHFKWNSNSNQYRWVLATAVMRRDHWGSVYRRAMVPDQISQLHKGDLVDVYVGYFDQTNYGELQAPMVIRLVCRDADSACKKAEEKKLGGANEVVTTGKPTMTGLTFSKFYDLDGNRLQPKTP